MPENKGKKNFNTSQNKCLPKRLEIDETKTQSGFPLSESKTHLRETWL